MNTIKVEKKNSILVNRTLIKKQINKQNIVEIDPRIANLPSNMTHNEIWENIEHKLNLHYGSNLKLKY